MKNRRNYYRILQVQHDAPLEVIRASYRALMKELKQHPDLGGNHRTATLLNEAYQTLSDSKRREDYDREMLRSHTKPTYTSRDLHKRPLVTLFCPFCNEPLAHHPQPGEHCQSCGGPLRSGANRPDRREIARLPKNDRFIYFTTWPPRVGKPATMIDLSPKGMRFLCPRKLADGSVLYIRTPYFEAMGRIVSITENEEKGGYEVGLSFIATDFSNPRGFFFATAI